jgi:uncharacterized protein (DUF2236 family)
MTVERSDLEAELQTLVREVRDPRAGIYGPASVSWRVDREAVIMLGGGRAALLQLAHPYVAHAVDQHSQTKTDPLGRFRRTFQNVFSMVFGDLDHAIASARRVHTIHTHITGTIRENVGAYAEGHRYLANDERALFWVHATLVDSAIQMYELVISPLSLAEKDAYYAESRRFARLFGIPARVMPGDWRGFRTYMEERFASPEITVGKPALELRHFLLAPPRPVLAPLASWYTALTSGLMPARLRAQLELPFGLRERAVFRASIPALRAAFRLAPPRLRYFPDYFEAQARIAGREPRDRVGRFLEKVALDAIAPPRKKRAAGERRPSRRAA